MNYYIVSEDVLRQIITHASIDAHRTMLLQSNQSGMQTFSGTSFSVKSTYKVCFRC